MRAESQTAYYYLLVDRVVQVVERHLENSVQDVNSYPKGAIKKRLAQALAMHLTVPFIQMQLDSRYGEHPVQSGELASELRCAGLQINTLTGKVNLSAKLMFVGIGKFLVLWLVVLLIFLRSFFSLKPAFGKATLVYGVGAADLFYGGNALRFEEFCRVGNLDALRKATRYVVLSAKPVLSTNEAQFIYCRSPLLTLFERNKLGFVDSFLFLADHFSCLLTYFSLVFRLPVSCLLWRDFADDAVALSLNRRNLIETNIITNSNWVVQYLWMTCLPGRSYLTLMALYSLNSSRLVFKSEPLNVAEHPSLRHLNVDCVLIWDTFYAKELKRLGVLCATEVVAPILWYSPEMTQSRPSTSAALRICLFDVPPRHAVALRDLGLSGSYYNAEVMMRFLDDVLAVVSSISRKSAIEVEVILKHKRVQYHGNDDYYYQHVDQLLSDNLNMFLAKEDSNLYTLISSCDVAIAIPYSSPAYIAAHLGVPSIFYDPTVELDPVVFDAIDCAGVRFAAGRDDLGKLLLKSMRGDGRGNLTILNSRPGRRHNTVDPAL